MATLIGLCHSSSSFPFTRKTLYPCNPKTLDSCSISKETLIFTILFYYLTIQLRKKVLQKRCLDIFSLVFAFLSQVPRAFGSTAMEAARSLWRCQGQCEQLPCNLVSQTNTLSFFCLPEGQGKKKA